MNKPSIPNLPHDIRLEAEALGLCLYNPVEIGVLMDLGGVDLFFHDAHRSVCKKIFELENIGADPSNLSLLADHLKDDRYVVAAGGIPFVTSLTDGIPRGAKVRSTAERLKRFAEKRKLLGIGDAIEQKSQDRNVGPDEILEYIENSCLQIRDDAANASRGVMHVSTILHEAMPMLDRVWEGNGKLLGTSTGFPAVDEKTAGLVSGEFNVLGARPSVGKTAFASELALRIAQQGDGVVFISLETSRLQLIQRFLSRLSGISYSDMSCGYLSRTAKVRLLEAVKQLHGLPLFIDDRVSRQASFVRSTLRQVAKREKIKLAIVDYIQLLTAPGATRFELVTNVSIQMKAAAKEIGEISGATLLCLAQLNREATDRDPQLHDLRESGQLEQDADVVFLLHDQSVSDNRSHPHTKILKVAKCKNGPADQKIPLRYFPTAFRFEEPRTVGITET